jgi:hypothetical protein
MSDHLIGAASLAIGLPGLVEVCLHLGEFFVTRLEIFRHADESIAAYVLKISTHWDIQKAGLKKLQEIQNVIDNEIKDRLAQILEQLRRILDRAVMTIAKYASFNTSSTHLGSQLRDLRYALLDKKVLDSIERDIVEWENLFKKRLVLLVDNLNAEKNIGLPQGLMNLRIPLLQPSEDSDKMDYIFNSELYPEKDQIVFEGDGRDTGIYLSKSHPNIVIEDYDCSFVPEPEAEVRKLTAQLLSSQPELMHILPCKGFYSCQNGAKQKSYHLLFSIPQTVEGATLQSLRSLLLSGKPRHALNDRVCLANEIATAVWYVHSGHIVHKSIRPETILVLSPPNANSDDNRPLGRSFLAGFCRFRGTSVVRRSDGVNSFCAEDLDPMRWPYRHPQRWGEKVKWPFTMLHDIYSLGVVLLEIGLWQSLIKPVADSERRSWRPTTGLGTYWLPGNNDIPDNDPDEPRTASFTRAEEFLDASRIWHHTKAESKRARDAEHVKSWLLTIAQQKLPRVMGNTYSSVVVACLTCVEGGLSPSSIKPSHLDGSNVGLGYMESVIEQLERIRL